MICSHRFAVLTSVISVSARRLQQEQPIKEGRRATNVRKVAVKNEVVVQRSIKDAKIPLVTEEASQTVTQANSTRYKYASNPRCNVPLPAAPSEGKVKHNLSALIKFGSGGFLTGSGGVTSAAASAVLSSEHRCLHQRRRITRLFSRKASHTAA